MSERYEPIDIPRGTGDPVPTCPLCDGLLRRFVTDRVVAWRCDLHGVVAPVWSEPFAEDE